MSLLLGFFAQASALDYQTLFFLLLPFALIDGLLVGFVISLKPRGKVWLVLIAAIFGFISYLEMACRVWLDLRLF
ncbi:MAG: hypothetical protein AB1813_15870 [Verrucomicrobiota bacterium]